MNFEPYIRKEVIGNATLYLGDCLGVLSKFDSKEVDAVVTSPPYDTLRKYGDSVCQWGDHIWKPLIKKLKSLISTGGVMVWVVADETVNGTETGTSFKQALYAMKCGFNLHDTMIYQVPGTGAKGSNLCYWQVFEYMFVFSKGKIRTVNRIKDKKNIKAGSKCTSFKQARDGVNTRLHPKNGTIVQEIGYRDNVWVIPSGNGHNEFTGHPAPFPLAIPRDHLRSWTNPNDLILDPLMGSGTTGIACMDLGRKFIGIEINPDYFDIACKRIEQAQKQLRLFDNEVANAS